MKPFFYYEFLVFRQLRLKIVKMKNIENRSVLAGMKCVLPGLLGYYHCGGSRSVIDL